MQDQDVAHRATTYLSKQLAGLQALSDQLDLQQLEQVVACLAQANKVLIAGVGKSWHIGGKIAATFNSTGTTAINLHATEALHGDLGAADENDVALVLSFSGESEEIRSLVQVLNHRQLPIIALTRRADSSLGRASQHVLPVPVREEACPFNLAPTCSSLVTLALGDLLAILTAEARGFKRDDFHLLHPAGAIGQSLTPLREVMRVGDRLAEVPTASSVRDALNAMTEARGGAVVVTGTGRAVAGIMTDGDVRRHMLAGGSLESAVDELMTCDPVTLKVDHRVVDAWDMFQQQDIDDLVVVEKDGTLAGILDIQDLPKLKQL